MRKLFLILLVGISSIANGQLVAHAGIDQSVERSIGFAKLDGSTSTGASTYLWRLINPTSQPTEGKVVHPTQSITFVKTLPYNPNGWKYELTVGNGVSTAKDTVVIFTTWANPPPQASSFRLLTAADTAALNVHNKGLARPGDYYIDGANDGFVLTGGKKTDIFTNQFLGITFTPGMHVLINCNGGAYNNIQLNFNAANITATNANPIIVCGINGQLECANLLLTNAKNVRVTGKYQRGVSGDDRFLGWDGGTAFRSGTFGIYCNNRWTQLGSACITFSGPNTDSCTIDNLEWGNGGFAGMFAKEHDVDSAHIWNCFRHFKIQFTYAHDTHGELIYAADTGGDSTDFFSGQWHWQHTLQDWEVSNNVWVRAGNEIMQMGDQGGKVLVHNNIFFMGALNWRSPFDESQDQSLQMDFRNNGNYFYNNITIGAGEYHGNIFPQTKHRNIAFGDPPFVTNDSNKIYNNAFLINHGFIDNFANIKDTLNPQFLAVRNNYYGMSTFTANQIFTDSRGTNTQEVFRVFTNSALNHISYKNNISDNTKTGSLTGSSSPRMDSSGNTKASFLPFPLFANAGYTYLGVTDSFAAQNLTRWTDSIYATWGDEYPNKAVCCSVRQGTPFLYSAGDLVTFESKIYKSRINSNGGNMPYPADSTNWQLQQWKMPDGTLTTNPPDDLRLLQGDFYQVKGMGLDAFYNPTYSTKRHRWGKYNYKNG